MTRYGYTPITRSPAAIPATPWPGGKRLAVYVGLGIEEYRFGEGRTEDLVPGVDAPDLVNTAWRDYGNRVGAFRVMDRLAQAGIAPTVLLNTAVYDSAPDVVAAARAHGAEIVGHGVFNSDSLAGMTPATERAYLDAVADRIEREEGRRPLGWSSPWLTHTPTTIDQLPHAGYRYLLDLRVDDRPVWLTAGGRPLLSIPYSLELNDSSTAIGRQASGAEFADMIVDEFDELLDASRTGSPEGGPLVMSVIVHSFICGAPFRLRQLTRALAHLAAHADEVWFTTPGGIYEHVTAARPT